MTPGLIINYQLSQRGTMRGTVISKRSFIAVPVLLVLAVLFSCLRYRSVPRDHRDPSPTVAPIIYVSTEQDGVEPEVSNLSLSPPRSDTLFAYAGGYAGQQGSGVLSLSTFQCFLTSIHGKNALIAEPKFKDSYFLTYATSKLSFSSLLDLDHFNKESSRIGYPGMINLEKFIKESPRQAVYICIRGFSGTSRQKMVWQAPRINGSVKCLQDDDIQSLSGQYHHQSIYSNWCIVRVVELWATLVRKWNGKGAPTVNSVHKLVFGEWSPAEVTLLFTLFSFYKYPPLIVPSTTIDCTKIKQTRTQFQPAKRIIQDAETYKDMFLGGENRLAIMLRVERLVIGSRGNPLVAVKKCFSEVFKLKRKLAVNFIPLVTIDVGGRYGTGTSNNNQMKDAIKYSKEAFESLYNNTWSVSAWEESFTKAAGGITDRGYIAALQRVLASRADCLVLVGGGDFQTLAAQDFMHYHNSSECIHLVCDNNGHVQQAIDTFRTNIGHV